MSNIRVAENLLCAVTDGGMEFIVVETRLLGIASIHKLLIKFSVPSIISMLIVASYNLVDKYFISVTQGADGLSAVQIVFPYLLLITAFMMLISTGATTLVSFALGAKNRDRAEKVVGSTLFMVIAISVIITLFSFLFLESFLRLLGANDALIPIAIDYFKIIAWGTIFTGVSLGLNSCMRSEGHANISMMTMIAGGVLNLILDPIMILGMGMGITGAALSTVIGQAFSAAITIWFFVGGKSKLVLRMENLKPDWSIIWSICRIGSAQFFLQIGTTFVTIIYNQALMQTGTDPILAVGAVGLVNNIAALIYMSITGIGQGMQPIVAYNYSAKNYERVKKLLFTAFKYSIVIAVFGFLCAQLLPKQVIWVFNSQDTEFLDFAVYAMRINFLLYPIIGFQIIMAEYYQATGRGFTATILSLSRQIIALVPIVIIASMLWGINGVLFSAPAADLVAFGIAMWYLKKEVKLLNAS